MMENSIDKGGYNDNICFICTEKIGCFAIGACNHPVCHICAVIFPITQVRMRALYKNMECPLCKTLLKEIILCIERVSFDHHPLIGLKQDFKLGLYFTSPEAQQMTTKLLKFNCPAILCTVACSGGWADLKNHASKTHRLQFCSICTEFKKSFTHEHLLYTASALKIHKDEVHPTCEFCKEAFYGNDELYEHCKIEHEQCFLCQQTGSRHQYYQNYQSLEKHFGDAHIVCKDVECLQQKFVVFATDIDFEAHNVI